MYVLKVLAGRRRRLQFDFRNLVNFSSVQKTIQDISETDINIENEFDRFIPDASLLQWVYKQSKIADQDSFYESYALISYKTSNSFSDIGKLPFWKFNNLLVHINRIIDNENGDGDKNGGASEQSESMQKSQKQMMGNMSSSFKGLKPPKL